MIFHDFSSHFWIPSVFFSPQLHQHRFPTGPPDHGTQELLLREQTIAVLDHRCHRWPPGLTGWFSTQGLWSFENRELTSLVFWEDVFLEVLEILKVLEMFWKSFGHNLPIGLGKYLCIIHHERLAMDAWGLFVLGSPPSLHLLAKAETSGSPENQKSACPPLDKTPNQTWRRWWTALTPAAEISLARPLTCEGCKGLKSALAFSMDWIWTYWF